VLYYQKKPISTIVFSGLLLNLVLVLVPQKKYQKHLNLVPTFGSNENLVPPHSSAQFTFKTPFSSSIPLQMSSSSSDNDTDSTGIYHVDDSPWKNTRSTSSAGQKKNASRLKAFVKGKRKTKSKLPTAAKKKIVGKIRSKLTSKAAGSQVAKASNFSAEEDNMLAKAYVNISTNPIHGSGMKSNDFWENVRRKWKELIKTEGNGVFISRTSLALKLRHEPMERLHKARSKRKPVGAEQCCKYSKKDRSSFRVAQQKTFPICWVCGVSSTNAEVPANSMS
jgi:hypothetical protein